MAEVEVKEEVKTEEVKEEKKDETTEKVDVEKVKADAVKSYIDELGYSDEDIKNILQKHKEAEDSKKDDLTKANDTLTATTKELAKERDARIMAEAALEAVKLGAVPELVDDLVIVAKAKVTSEKSIQEVIKELKEADSVYFKKEKEDKDKHKHVTRKSTSANDKKKDDSDDSDDGSIAARIFKNRQTKESHFFKN